VHLARHYANRNATPLSPLPEHKRVSGPASGMPMHNSNSSNSNNSNSNTNGTAATSTALAAMATT